MSLSEPSSIDADRALVEAALARVPGAFERLVRAYQGLCWHILNRMVRNPEDTRELCQETFLRVHLRLHQYRFESPLKAWIGQVAYSIGLRFLERKRLPLVDLSGGDDEGEYMDRVGDDFDLEAANADAEIAAELHRAIDRLPAVPRTVLMLYHFEEATIPEIAIITGLPEGSIKSHLFRGRLRLRKQLESLLGEAA